MHRSPDESPLEAPADEQESLIRSESRQVGIELHDSGSSDEPQPTSTLIEFPGVNRHLEPPWRRELSRRVREAQERRVKEQAESPQLRIDRQQPDRDPVLSQLELVPELATPEMNQLVENALRRVERARRAEQTPSHSEILSGPVSHHGAATGVARAKAKELPCEEDAVTTTELPVMEVAAKTAKRSLTRRKLAIVPAPELKAEKAIAKPVRLITDGVDDGALSYLDNHFPETHAGSPANRAGLGRRISSAVFDSVFVAILVTPLVAVVEVAGGDWTDARIVSLMAGASLLVLFAYQTFSIALRGQTWGMRLLSLRAVDPGTGLIPTGSQSIKRALAYVFSVATFGLGFLFAFFGSENLALHDRFSGTIVAHN